MGKYQLLSNIFPKGSSERVLSKVQRKPGFQLIEKFLLCSKVKPEKLSLHGWAGSQPHLSLSTCQTSSVPTDPALGVRAFPA